MAKAAEKAKDWKDLDNEEILEKVGQLKKELMNFRFQAKTGKLERQSVIRHAKRDVARLLTIMNDPHRSQVQSQKKTRKKAEVKK